MKQIVCMKWGTLYGADYVNKLYGMVKRNITDDFRFVCLTDDPTGVRAEVECLECPTIDIPAPWNNTGWRKVTLWAASLNLMEGAWLFLDLDVVVTGRLDDFFNYKPEQNFVVMKNWTQPGTNIGNTSVYRFTVGSHSHLLDSLVKDPQHQVETYRNEQTFVCKEINDFAFWPDEWCILFKTHCVPSFPLRYWKSPELPAHSKIVAFPGNPNPDMAALGQWPEKKWYKKIYKQIKPAHWVTDHWRE